jgi:hypothetical protein
MLLNKQATSNYQLVELKIPANSPNQRFNFQDQPLLRDKAIEKIEYYLGASLLAHAPSGVISGTAASVNVYVTFADQSGFEFIQNIPIWELQGLGNTANLYNTKNGLFNIGLRKIVFPKSYVTYNAPAIIPVAYSICFGIYYK